MNTVGIVAHPGRPAAKELAVRVASLLDDAGVGVRVLEDDAAALGIAAEAAPRREFGAGLDAAVSLGGDGTMLRTVDTVYEAGVPVLGVNLGQLGFLTEVEPDDAETAVKRVLDGEYQIEERMVVRLAVDSEGPAGGRWAALNECLLEKASSGRLVRLSVSVGGEFFTTYAADGMIVATPTGSTAYAFSARGPIISPSLRCLLVTPVSPHMLFDRSLVLDSREEIRFEVVGEAAVELSVDGRTLGEATTGDVVTCSAAAHPARLIVFGPRHFHQMLKAKFRLPDR